MSRPGLLLLLILCYSALFGQTQLPAIKATSDTLDIRVGDDYFSKGGWILDPGKKPDVFSIGSKWPYDFKKVTFTTDLDSISFFVQPGRTYDFIVILNQLTRCYIRIAALSNPVFMDLRIAVPVLMGLSAFILLLFLMRRRIGALPLLYTGYAVPVLFWAVTCISGNLHGDYSHHKDVISELGAVGTRPEAFTSASFVFLAMLSTLFSLGFYKASQRLKVSVVPAMLSFSKPVSMIWAAFFPLGNEFHNVTGPLPFLTILASLSAYLMWRKGDQFSRLRLISLACFLVMSLIMTRFIRPFGLDYEGLVQRFFYLGWTVWVIALTCFLSRRLIKLKI